MGLNHARRILVYRIGQLGDTIIALPAMWAVRRCFPNAYMALLSDRHSRSGYVLAQQVLPSEGLFDEYLSYEAGIHGTDPRNMLAVLPALRRRRFDTLVYLAPRLRTRWQVWRDLFFFRLAGIRQFIGHKGFKPLPPRTPGERLPQLEHEADHLLDRLAKSGIPVSARDRRCMDLRLTQRELLDAEAWLEARIRVCQKTPLRGPSRAARPHPRRVLKQCSDILISDTFRGPVVGFGPGSKWPSKVWPLERYAALGQRLVAELDAFPIVFGGPEDRELGERLLAQWGRGANAAGELNVRQAAAVLRLCQLYVGNDTGTMHLAAAVGTTCVVAFAAQDWPGRWYPYGDQHVVLRRPVPCEGCMLSVCTEHGMACMMEISVEDMWRACQQVLARETRQPVEPSAIHPSVQA
jgi:ADP-heptose:LPS heptosyltransferase